MPISRTSVRQSSFDITASSLPSADVSVPALKMRSSKFNTGVKSDNASLRSTAANCSISRSFVKDTGRINSGKISYISGIAM